MATHHVRKLAEDMLLLLDAGCIEEYGCMQGPCMSYPGQSGCASAMHGAPWPAMHKILILFNLVDALELGGVPDAGGLPACRCFGAVV